MWRAGRRLHGVLYGLLLWITATTASTSARSEAIMATPSARIDYEAAWDYEAASHKMFLGGTEEASLGHST